jgi:hypothetical protein
MEGFKDLLNYKGLSRLLAGNQTSISRNRCPKKYRLKVDELLSIVEAWAKNNDTEQAPTTDEEAQS